MPEAGATWGWGVCGIWGVLRRALRPEGPEGRSSQAGPVRGTGGDPWPRSRALPRTLPRSLARPLFPARPRVPAALTGPAARQQSQRADLPQPPARASPPRRPGPAPCLRPARDQRAVPSPQLRRRTRPGATLPGHAAEVGARRACVPGPRAGGQNITEHRLLLSCGVTHVDNPSMSLRFHP